MCAVVAVLGGAVTGSAAPGVVINEIFYDPPDRTRPLEFVELYNPTGGAVDMSGWVFDAGIDCTLPAGTTIAAGGYVVVAQDASAFAAAYGFVPAATFTGKLSNDGETLRLRDGAGATVDSVTYGVGFPWPTAADGAGSSLELINPAMDRNNPGNWRASGLPAATLDPLVLVPEIDPTWHYRKGTSEASSPTTAWTLPDFVEDGTWAVGQTSIGYGDNDDNTELSDMRNSYSTLYLRRVFTLSADRIPARLVLKVRVDDGCVVWINGVEVARFHVPDGELAYNALAYDHEASTSVFEEITLSNADAYLHAGDNVMAVHGINGTLGSSDFTIDAALEESIGDASSAPTPGARNSVFNTVAPPAVASVTHSPAAPASGEAVTITARLSDPDGMGAVTLEYQDVAPGSYVRKTDATYSTGWTPVAMHDDGSAGDATAGDGIYTAVLPASLQVNRHLIRYRVMAEDATGLSVTVPYADDDSPNFAYFVYDGLPGWSGAFIPGSTATQNFPASTVASMPALQLLAQNADVINSQYVSSYNGQRFYGTIVWQGVVYDHVQFNNRGEFSTYQTGKNKWRIHFNRAHDVPMRDAWGKPFAQPWDEINLNACASPWVPANRGMAGLEEAVAFHLMQLVGLPSSSTVHLQLRVIDAAAEATSSQYEGDLWGLYLAIEQPDGSFLDERSLPDGSVYKIESSAGDKKHQGATQPTDTSDWDTFLVSCRSTQTEAWWRAHLDLQAYFGFRAANRLVGDVDVREGWNHYFYHRPDDVWVPMPWDYDMSVIPKTHQSGTIDQKACLTISSIAMEYRNRAREIYDLMTTDASPSGGQFGQLVDEHARLIAPTGLALNWTVLDADLWNRHPRATTAHYGKFYLNPTTDTRFGGTWTRTLETADFAGFEKHIVGYGTGVLPAGQSWVINSGVANGYGRGFVNAESLDSAIPYTPTATYVGEAGYPVDDLRFTSSAFSDPQGAGTFGAVQWRIAEIAAPGIPLFDASQPRVYEITDVWRSDELGSADGEVTIPSATLRVGHTYRVRVRHRDNTGRWSHWSAPVQFAAGDPVSAPDAGSLVISEFMYGPPALSGEDTAAGFTDRQAFEYIELLNVSKHELDLGATAITTAVTFSFPQGTKLAPGARILVVKDHVAFEHRYGTGLPIAGEYSGKLDNAGERIVVQSSGVTVIDFTYSDSAPWPTEADGSGASLVLVNPFLAPDPSLATSWRASRTTAGHPGSADPIGYAEWAARYAGAVDDATADDDGDGLDNLLEYALGTAPAERTASSAAGQAGVSMLSAGEGTEPYLTYTFTHSGEPGDVAMQVEFSADLVNWTADGVMMESAANADGTVTEIWRAPQSMAAHPSLYVRLRVTRP